ncbi:MAG: hypothetical protein KC516_03925 [Nanoarchaeota archaeon]|nr:hypothetical protein [Nanoarchaeota archaeon]
MEDLTRRKELNAISYRKETGEYLRIKNGKKIKDFFIDAISTQAISEKVLKYKDNIIKLNP